MALDLQKERGKVFAGEDGNLYLHIGYFMTWFASVELRLTLLLAFVTNLRDLRAFDLLASGMDARVKCERLRKASETYKKPIGPNFEKSLHYFERKLIKRRNLISHSFVTHPSPGNVFHFGSASRSPAKAFGDMPLFDDAKPVESLRLFEEALWLNWFNDDLGAVMDSLTQSGTLEITRPLAPVPIPPR